MIFATVVGNLGADAEMRVVPSGEAVLEFRVASTKRWRGNEVTTWVRCSMWGKRGEGVSRYLTKGTQVTVMGEMGTREHNGKTHVEVRVSELVLGSRGSQRQQTEDHDTEPPQAGGGVEDQIPFAAFRVGEQ